MTDEVKTPSPCDYVDETKHLIKTERCGLLTVYVQGSVKGLTERTPVFLTMHDIGSNHSSFHIFSEHPTMEKIKARSVFIHVDVPGQENNSPDLSEDYEFPSMQDLGEDLIYVLDYFNVMYVVSLGDGAGSNILTRFSMAYPNRVLGNILLDCTSTMAGMMEYLTDKITNFKFSSSTFYSPAELMLFLHKFGGIFFPQLEKNENQEKILEEFSKNIQNHINQTNLKLFMETYLNRSELTTLLREKLRVDTLLVTGAKSHHAEMVQTMHTNMNPRFVTMLKLDDIGNVMQEAPHRLAHNVLLFCQGLGLLSALNITKLKFHS